MSPVLTDNTIKLSPEFSIQQDPEPAVKNVLEIFHCGICGQYKVPTT